MRDLEPGSPQEYIIKGVVHAAIGQQAVAQQAKSQGASGSGGYALAAPSASGQ